MQSSKFCQEKSEAQYRMGDIWFGNNTYEEDLEILLHHGNLSQMIRQQQKK